jgi:NADH:ubiquinone oxidoreductase subunit E
MAATTTVPKTYPKNEPLGDAGKKAVIDTIIEQYKDLPGATMVVLNELQSAIGFVSTYMQEYVAERLQVPLGVNPGETTSDGNITFEVCRCVGACSQAPVVVVDEEVYGRVRPNKIPQLLKPMLDEKE